MMLMIKSKIRVRIVGYGKGKAELISAYIKKKYGESTKLVVAFVPEINKERNTEKHEELIKSLAKNI